MSKYHAPLRSPTSKVHPWPRTSNIEQISAGLVSSAMPITSANNLSPAAFDGRLSFPAMLVGDGCCPANVSFSVVQWRDGVRNPVPNSLPVDLYIEKTAEAGDPIPLPPNIYPPIMTPIGLATIDRASAIPRTWVLLTTSLVSLIGGFAIAAFPIKYVVAAATALIVLLIQLWVGRSVHISCMATKASDTAVYLDRPVRKGDRVHLNIVPVGAL